MPRLMLNSRWVDLPVAADTSLLDFLRQDRGLTAAKPAWATVGASRPRSAAWSRLNGPLGRWLWRVAIARRMPP